MKHLSSTIIALLICVGVHAQSALNFDGQDDFVNIGDSPQLNFDTTDFTIEFWVQTTATPQSPMYLLSKRATCFCGNFWDVRMTNSGTVYLETSAVNCNPIHNLTSFSTINDGQWHHVAATRGGGALRIYIDGVLDDTLAAAPINLNNTDSIKVGSGACAMASNGSLMNGSIDEVRIWRRELSEAEIQAYMDAEICSLDTSLIVYYMCNEGIPNDDNTGVSVLDDASGNNNVGTLEQFALNGTTSNFVDAAPVINFVSVGFDTTVSVSGITLTANMSNVSYQWIDCDNGSQPIAGATNQNFTPTTNGNYAVELMSGTGCYAYSECIAVTTVGIDEYAAASVQVYPNPSNGIFNIEHDFSGQSMTIEMYDAMGRKLFSQPMNGSLEVLDLTEYPAGIYISRIIGGETDHSIRLLKR